MSEPKKFKRGKHTYTRWGHNFKEVRVEGKKKDNAPNPTPPPPVSMSMDQSTENGIYANTALVHRSPTEVLLDFAFLPPGQNRGRVRSRIVISHKQARKLAELLTKTTEELDSDGC